jgi:HSP20 family protein
LASETNPSTDQRLKEWPSSRDWRCERDPFDLLRQVVCLELEDPFLNSGFGDFFSPRLELRETKEAFILTADVPGLDQKDLDVTWSGNRLAIHGKRTMEATNQGEKFYARERSYGSFERTLTLPDVADGDHMEAKIEKGVLRLRIPKKPGQEPKRITINSEGQPAPGVDRAN